MTDSNSILSKASPNAKKTLNDIGKGVKEKMVQSISVGEYYTYAKGALMPSIALEF